MSMLLRQLARYIAEKAASDPVIREKAANIAREVVDEARHVAREDDRAFAAALKQRLDHMRIRLNRLETATSNKRELITEVMSKATLRKVTEPDFTLSLREVPRGLQLNDEAEIPEAYWQPQPAKLDRQAVLRDLRDDVSIPGASLNNGGQTISVRTQ